MANTKPISINDPVQLATVVYRDINDYTAAGYQLLMIKPHTLPVPDGVTLTDQQQTVARLLLEDMTTAQIARQLGRSEQRIAAVFLAIRRRLNVQTLAGVAVKLGIKKQQGEKIQSGYRSV